MGVISRKIFPACGRMCVCCPALRSRSRQPVKRYKKLLADIFPKSPDAPSNDRKIVKLCEYAAKNPFRIPKIVKYLEERCYKELRSEQIKFLSIIMEAYNKLLGMCKEQMAYFAISLLGVVTELLDSCKQEAVELLGCQTLTAFIYNQTDASYSHNIEKFIPKVCRLAREKGEEQQRIRLRASSLQCLSAMVWFMVEFSYIFDGFDEIVHVTLDNYEPDVHNVSGDERHHNWVDEVVRSEGRVGGDNSPNCMVIRPRPEKKDPSLLTREEIETPKIWAQICLQRMAELAKESRTTMRRVLDPMLVYFDAGCHWVPRQGLALVVLCDLTYMVDRSGNAEFILASIVRHLDHKSISHDAQLKSCIIRVATTLVRQIRLGAVLGEFGFVTDLCRHLRRSLQANVESGRELNNLLQNSIEDCLLEVAKGITDAQPLCDMMAITLEKLPSSGFIARATIGSLTVVAHMISLVLISSHSQQAFPEALLIHLLRAMLHPDIEARVGSHQIFSILLIANSSRQRYEVSSLRANCLYEPRRWQSSTASALASITARLEKLRKEKNGIIPEKVGYMNQDDSKGMDSPKEEWKQGCVHKSSPNLYNMSTGLSEVEPYTLKFSEDQIAQLLSAFWIQATLPDNLPTNFESIAHSYVLTILSSRLLCPSSHLVMCFFQLPLSLRKISLGPYNGALPATCQRSLFTLSLSMLMFAAKIYQIMDLVDIHKPFEAYDVDPYLGITEDMQLFIRPQVDVREYGSAKDSQMASSLLFNLRNKACDAEKIVDVLAQNLSSIIEMAQDDIAKQLSEPFTPDDALVLGPQLVHNLDHNQIIMHSKKFSFDEDFSANSSMEDDTTSEVTVADVSRFIPKIPSTPSSSNIIGIGQLMESALQVAGQVAGTTVSSSPLPYDTMASHCEALGTGQRRKLSSWLAHENHSNMTDKSFRLPDGLEALRKITGDDVGLPLGGTMSKDRCLMMKLPPASPFDNFLKAAGC